MKIEKEGVSVSLDAEYIERTEGVVNSSSSRHHDMRRSGGVRAMMNFWIRQIAFLSFSVPLSFFTENKQKSGLSFKVIPTKSIEAV